MCGRYTFFTDKELQEVDEIIEQISNEIMLETMKAGDIFPTNAAPVLLPQDEIVVPRLMRWGFPGFGTKNLIINARSETAREKKLFGAALSRKRCIIPSTGFYEWDASKKKYLFNVPDSGMLYMAGIYNLFEGENRFVILTADANESMREVHNRMPVVIPSGQINQWLFDDSMTDTLLYGPHPFLRKQLAG